MKRLIQPLSNDAQKLFSRQLNYQTKIHISNQKTPQHWKDTNH